jgi:hypothetical protein
MIRPVLMAVIFLLLFTWAAKAWSPTIRLVDQTDLEGTDCCILRVYCDGPRGNIVYVSHSIGASSPGVAALHQPEVCK